MQVMQKVYKITQVKPWSQTVKNTSNEMVQIFNKSIFIIIIIIIIIIIVEYFYRIKVSVLYKYVQVKNCYQHLSCRLTDNIPVNSFKILTVKRPRNRQRSTKKKTMEKNLNDYNLNWDFAIEMAIDREHWNNCCKKMSYSLLSALYYLPHPVKKRRAYFKNSILTTIFLLADDDVRCWYPCS